MERETSKIFFLQFETVAENNGWDYEERGRCLVGSLRSGATDILTILGQHKAKDYCKPLKVLGHTYCPPCSESKYGIKLMNKRYNGKKETLRKFAQS